MAFERDCIYEMEVEVMHLNENSAMKPAAYQSLFARLADRHLSDYGADFNTTMKHGMAWALVSLSIEVVQPISTCLRFHASTWFSQRKGPYFRREFLFCDEANNPVFRGCTYSVLLDMKTRTVFRKKETPVSLTSPINDFTIEADPHFRGSFDFTDIDHRKVRSSYLDALGHVNNCRYGDFAYDALSDAERAGIGELKRMDIYFQSELRPGDEFTIRKAVAAEEEHRSRQIIVQGMNDTKKDVSFHIILQF